jgi:hypothetical protein
MRLHGGRIHNPVMSRRLTLNMKTNLCLKLSFSVLFLGPFVAATAQTSVVRASWKDLVKESTAIVVGTIVGTSEVVRADKIPKDSGAGIDAGVTLPASDELQLGKVFYLRVAELVKASKGIKVGKTVTIFKPGWHKDGDPTFELNRRYLIFLRPAETDPKTFASAVVEPRQNARKEKVRFNAESSYSVTFGEDGVVRLTGKNRSVVAEVRRVVRQEQSHVRRREVSLAGGDLVKVSAVIVAGNVEEEWQLIRPKKAISQETPLKDGGVLVTFPNPEEYVVGRVVRLRIDEVLKPYKKLKAGDTITIFLRGRLPYEGDAFLLAKQKYLVFLCPLKTDGKEFLDTAISKPGATSPEVHFDAKSSYVVIGGNVGASRLTAENSKLVEEVKAALRKLK